MHIVFGWGDEQNYHVVNYSLSLGTVSGDTKLANCVPGEISMVIELPPDANPAQEFLAFAVDQHNTASDKGSGKIIVFKGKDVGESLQEVAFNQGWITDIDLSVSEHDEKFNISVRIAAADVTVSGINFMHRGRGEHFS